MSIRYLVISCWTTQSGSPAAEAVFLAHGVVHPAGSRVGVVARALRGPPLIEPGVPLRPGRGAARQLGRSLWISVSMQRSLVGGVVWVSGRVSVAMTMVPRPFRWVNGRHRRAGMVGRQAHKDDIETGKYS